MELQPTGPDISPQSNLAKNCWEVREIVEIWGSGVRVCGLGLRVQG